MRRFPNIVLRRDVQNQSSRDGAEIKLIVLHSTESSNVPNSYTDLASVAAWFDNPVAEASAHVIVDADGNSARCVPDERKAWAAAAYNAPGLHIEQIGRAAQSHWDAAELRETARWIASWSRRHGIPIRKGRTLLGRVVRRGVVTHSSLGVPGGGHSDPGAGYPLKRVLKMAKEYK